MVTFSSRRPLLSGDDGGIGAISFTATLEQRGPAAAVVLSDEQVAELGEGAKRFPVRATVAGYSWRGSVARMRGEFLLGLNREVREGAGVEAGEEVEVSLALDTEERTVEVPPALAAALAGDAAAEAAFDALAYTHRKEFARWVAEAKKEDTRERRVAQALEMLHEGRTRS
jgi:hypothetical protein